MRNWIPKIIFLSTILCFGCFKHQDHEIIPPEWPHYRLTGFIVDSLTKNPVDDCIVTIRTVQSMYDFMTAKDTTDSTGSFNIDSVIPGAYSIEAQKKDYLTLTDALMMEHRDTLGYRMALLKIADLPSIFVYPSAISITARTTKGASYSLIISNQGDGVPLAWKLSESSPVSWLDESPTNGIVAPNRGQTVKLNLSIGSRMEPGTYKTKLIIESNDPYKPTVSVSVKLKLVKVEPPS